jgi:hypothetical protein
MINKREGHCKIICHSGKSRKAKLTFAITQESQLQKSLCVIPSKDGIQSFQDILDPGFRRGDLNKLVLQLAQEIKIYFVCASAKTTFVKCIIVRSK